jgi:hypothetical protein
MPVAKNVQEHRKCGEDDPKKEERRKEDVRAERGVY